MRSHWLWKLKESVLINGMVLKDSPRRIVVISVVLKFEGCISILQCIYSRNVLPRC